MRDTLRWSVVFVFVFSLLVSGVVLTPSPAHTAILDPGDFEITGWWRQRFGMSLEDLDETAGEDEDGELSMIRETLRVEVNLDLPRHWGSMTAIVRADEEVSTDFSQDLSDPSKLNGSLGPLFGGAPINAVIPGAGTGDLPDAYEETEVRELYWDVELTDDIELRLGRQLVAWGKTDFFQAMDVIHGFDNSWRTFLSPDEERRKPLWMANANINLGQNGILPKGNLILLWAPGAGINEGEDIGTDFDFEGGRWQLAPFHGVNFLDPANTPFNFKHPDASANSEQFGARFSSTAFGRHGNAVEYDISYWHGFNQNPVFRPNTVSGFTGIGTPVSSNLPNPYGTNNVPTQGAVGEIIYPEIDVLGINGNYYYAPFDVVIRTEIAYTFDKPFIVGTARDRGGIPGVPDNLENCSGGFPGLCGIIEKDAVNFMLNFDKQVADEQWLGTNRPSFLSVQVFNDWIPSYSESDDIVDNVGQGALRQEVNTTVTAIYSSNFVNDKYNPSLALIWDATNGGGMFLPRFSYLIGDHWRFMLEWAEFIGDGNQTETVTDSITSASGPHLFDALDNNDRLMLRTTYQF